MIDWAWVRDFALDTLSVVCGFLLGMYICMALLLRLFIVQLSLDVRDFSTRLQAIVLLDSVFYTLFAGPDEYTGEPRETAYARSIRTGKPLDEVNAEIKVERKAQRKAHNQRERERRRKEQRDTDEAMKIMAPLVWVGWICMAILGGLVFWGFIEYLIERFM